MNGEEFKTLGVYKMRLIAVCAIIALCQLSAYSAEPEQQEPLFQSKDLNIILEWVQFDTQQEITCVIETDNYIHKINTDTFCAIISHKKDNHKFVKVRKSAYFLLLKDDIWSVYIVMQDDVDSPITKLCDLMLIEFYMKCSKPPAKQEENMMVF